MSPLEQGRLAFHRATSPLFALFTWEQKQRLAEWSTDPSLLSRLEELSGKANEGMLTAQEHAEYEGYIEANNLLAVLQAEARFFLAHREL